MRKKNNAENHKSFEIKWLPNRIATKAFLVVLFNLLPWAIRAQSPAVVWSEPISGPYYWYVYAGVALDQQDDFYYAGSFATPVFPIGSQTLTNRSLYDEDSAQNGFIAKFSKAGNFLWVRQIGGTRVDEANGCATDTNGNVFVTGSVGSTNVVLDGAVLTNSAPDMSSCFLIKYDPQGNLVWARQSAGNLVSFAQGTSVAIDAGGNAWLAGSFYSSNVVFGTNVLVNPALNESHPVSQDFLVKYSSAGDVLWAQTITVNDDVGEPPLVGVDTNGNAFFCDFFLGSAGAGTIAITNIHNSNASVLLAKFDPAGDVLWAEEAAHPSNDGALFPGGVAVDSQGDCRIAGSYWGGTAVFPSNMLPAPGENENNGFIAKFDASGNFLWANSTINQFNGSASVDAVGNCYTAGWDVISRYASNGTLLWIPIPSALKVLCWGLPTPREPFL